MCSRPPTAIFTLSLVVLALTTLSLAIFCRNSTHIQNVDVLDWNKLFTELGNFNLCLKTNSTSKANNTKQNETLFTASIADVNTNYDLNRLWPEKEGYFSVEGGILLSTLGLGHVSDKSIQLKIQQQKGEVNKACFTVKSDDAELLSHLKNQTFGNDPCLDTSVKTIEFEAHQEKHMPKSWCGPSEGIKFSLNIIGKSEWTTFLTDAEKYDVFLHMLAVSAGLFLCVVFILIWAAARGSVGVRRFSDRRGDMHLLPSEGHDDDEDF